MLRNASVILGAIVLVAIGGVYARSLSAGFVWLDHLEIVQGGLIVERWSDIPALLFQDDNFAGYHRPFYNLIHSLDRALWGLDPFGFHLSSVLLHCLNAMLVLALGRRLELPPLASASLALLWALHPINTASAGLIHSKADLFAGTSILTMLLGITVARKTSRRGGLAIAGLAFIVALFTKELAFAVPLGLTYWASREPRLRAFTAFTWLAALGVWILRSTVAAKTQHVLPIGRFDALMTFSTVYVDYVRRALLPFDPSVSDTVTAWSALAIGAKLRAGIGLVILVVIQRTIWRQEPRLRKWIVAFNVSLVPVSQFLIPTLHFRADRFLYLGTLAVVGLCVESFVVLRGRTRYRVLFEPRIAGMIALAVAIVFGWRTHARLTDFDTDETLFLSEVERTPDYLEGLSALAAHYDREGRFELADRYYGRCLAILAKPRAALSYLETKSFLVNRSFNLLALGRLEEVRHFIETSSVLIAPSNALDQLRYNLAVAHFRLQDFERALPILMEYAVKYPTDTSCRYLIGFSAKELGRNDVAREAFETYLRLAPDAPDRARVEDMLSEVR